MLTEQNIESELSYAYLHAVATRAGFSCTYTTRHLDNAGVDAQIDEDGQLLADDSLFSSFSLHVQLKASRVEPPERDGRFSFRLRKGEYDRLRDVRLVTHRILVVLLLPPNPEEWLVHGEGALISKRCAYWKSLRGAAPSENEEYQTVYIPRSQSLSALSLTDLMVRRSRGEDLPNG